MHFDAVSIVLGCGIGAFVMVAGFFVWFGLQISSFRGG